MQARRFSARGSNSAQDALIDRVILSQQQAIETMEANSAAVLAGFEAARRGMAETVAGRIRSGLEAQRALLDCRDLAGLGRLQATCLRVAADQCAEETARLLRLGGDIARAAGRRDP